MRQNSRSGTPKFLQIFRQFSILVAFSFLLDRVASLIVTIEVMNFFLFCPPFSIVSSWLLAAALFPSLVSQSAAACVSTADCSGDHLLRVVVAVSV